jgi:hypothetical protein
MVNRFLVTLALVALAFAAMTAARYCLNAGSDLLLMIFWVPPTAYLAFVWTKRREIKCLYVERHRR